MFLQNHLSNLVLLQLLSFSVCFLFMNIGFRLYIMYCKEIYTIWIIKKRYPNPPKAIQKR